MSAQQPAIDRFYCPKCLGVFRTAFSRCPLDGELLGVCRTDPLAGHEFADRYVIEECIGEGAMGRVYRARHRRVSRQFAIKVLFGDHAADAKMRSRFAREAEAAGRLSHENVISVIDFGETEQQLLYLVMDFVEGPTLTQLMLDEAPFDRDRAIRVVRQLCKGLAHAHSKGLIHRDFKGENVIVARDSDDGEICRIVDFGIAMMLEARQSHKLTTEGMVLGTPAVMSPEQATGDKVDLRTDLFALGVVFYEMLCGHLPFEGTPMQIARHNLVDRPPRIAERVPGMEVDPSLEDLAHWLMAKKAADRPADARAVIQYLDELVGVSGSRPSISTSQVGPLFAAQRADPTPAPYDMATPTPAGALLPRNHSTLDEGSAPTVMLESVSQPAVRSRRRPLLAVAIAGVVVAAGAAIAVSIGGADDQRSQPRENAASTQATSRQAAVAAKEQPPEPEPTAVEPEPTPVEPEPTPVEPEPTPVEPEVEQTPPVPEPAAVDSEREKREKAQRAKQERVEKLREKQEKLEKAQREKLDKAQREKLDKAQREKLDKEKQAQLEKAQREKAQQAAHAGEDERTDVPPDEITSLWKQVGQLANKVPSNDPDAAEIQDTYFALTSRKGAMMKSAADRVSYWKSLLRLKRRIARKLK